MINMVSSHNRCVVDRYVLAIVSAVALVATAGIGVTAQTPSAADGPWGGWAQCTLLSRGGDYVDEQVHTWRITGTKPRVIGGFRHWPALWTAEGRGRRGTDTWTVTVPAMTADIAIWEIPATNNIRIGSRHGLLVAPRAVRVASTAGTGNHFSLQEPEFPVTDGAKTSPAITGKRTRDVRTGPAWRKPAEVVTRETCTWNFVRGGSPMPPPSPAVAVAAAPPAAAPAEIAGRPTAGRAEATRVGRVESTRAGGETAIVPRADEPPLPVSRPTTTPSSSSTATLSSRVPTSVLSAAPTTRAAHLFTSVSPSSSVRSGDIFQIMFEARDADGVYDQNFNGPVTITAGAPGGSGFSYPVSANATRGSVTFNVFLNNAANGYTVTAVAPGLATVVTRPFDVTASRLAISNIGNVTASTPFSVTVTALDANNSVAENFTGVVTLTAVPTGASGRDFTAGKTATAVGGIARFTVSLDTAGSYQVIPAAYEARGVTSNPFIVTAR
jgi:hypothetical protein